jgi:energy-coupling factor transporter ATP-binding protein EcfA2
VGTLQGNHIQYSFPQVLKYLDAKGKRLFGKHFSCHEQDRQLLFKLCCYFVEDANTCHQLGLDLNKGLLLSGPVGCGKTSLLRLLPHLVPHKRHLQYPLLPCRNLVFQFNKQGYKTIETYAEAKPYGFDDLGAEPTGRHYGKDCNVLGEILISRYEHTMQLPLAQRALSKCHATTNLNADELQQRYGERVRSRMRAMFNLIGFPAESPDKRG